jgi:aerobic-type carbon monoxide dehydrogenase small subunit (CoxS/CutS family)
MRVELVVNGAPLTVDVAEDSSLLDLLREDLGLTGTKYGCGEGQCGACTVLVDGAACYACTTPAAGVAGRAVLTIEGLAAEGTLHPLQRSFLDCDAFQCGYCTPGFIMAALGLLNQEAAPSQERITTALAGNLCRCGGYRRIVAAVAQAAAQVAQAGEETA